MAGILRLSGHPLSHVGGQEACPVLWATIIASDARFGHHFSPRLLRDLFHPLSGAFGIAFTRLDRRIAEPLLDRDDLRPFFQEVRRKRMPSTMTAGLDVRG